MILLVNNPWNPCSTAGDIVVAKNMQSPRYVVCKRVLGLEGDHVIVRPSVGTEKPYSTIVSMFCLVCNDSTRNANILCEVDIKTLAASKSKANS